MLANDKLNTIKVLISEFLIDSYISISHDEFVPVNNVLKKYDEVKASFKNPSILTLLNSDKEYAWYIQAYWWDKKLKI